MDNWDIWEHLQKPINFETSYQKQAGMKKHLLLALPLISLMASCAQNLGADKYDLTTQWGDKSEWVKYEHFTDLGKYALLMNDFNAEDVEKVLCSEAYRKMDFFKPACTATVKRNSKGDVIFGRNMDVTISKMPAFITPIKGGKYETLAFTYKATNCPYEYDRAGLEKLDEDTEQISTLVFSSTDAMNEAGLYIETNMREMDSQYSFYSDGTTPGKTRANLLSLPALVAINCGTVKEALDFIQDSYDWCTPGFFLSGEECVWNTGFLIGDASGNYGLIEIARNKVYYTPYSYGQGNFYVHPELAEYAVEGTGFGRLATALKGLEACETEQQMMDNMQKCMWINELLEPGCMGYSDYNTNVNYRRETPVEEMQAGFEEVLKDHKLPAEEYRKGNEELLRSLGNVWSTAFNFGVNCKTRHLMLRLWERDDAILEVQWK